MPTRRPPPLSEELQQKIALGAADVDHAMKVALGAVHERDYGIQQWSYHRGDKRDVVVIVLAPKENGRAVQ